MVDREELIKKAIGLHRKADDLIMEDRIEDWLSLTLTIGQLKSLVYIQNKGKVSIKELARALAVAPSVATGIINRLVSHGMVNRTGSIEDRRIQLLAITDKGKALLDHIRRKHYKNISKILNSLSDEDLLTLVRGFSVLLNAIESHIESRKGAL
jgi:DNA-binding MarR family transcriptional regulator